MQLYRYLCISLLFIFMCTVITRPRKTNHTNNTQSTSFTHTEDTQKKHTVIIDLTNVLFKENQGEFAKKIGYGVLASYAITHWKSPGYRCLDMLAAISKDDTQKPHITITLKGRTMPRCIIELQEGTKNCSQVRTEIAQCIEMLEQTKFFSSIKEKNLMLAIINLILDPNITASVVEPMKQTVHLVQKLKKAGHAVYLFANAPDEMYSSIEKVKPATSMFNHLTNTYNLDPHNCIIIDDLEATIAAAKELGMDGIVYDKISNVTSKLRRCGIKI